MPATIVRAQLSTPLAAPYYVSIYNATTNARVHYCPPPRRGSLTECAVSYQVANNRTDTLVAYVSQDFPHPGPPVVDVRGQSTLTLTNAGYTGTMSVSITPAQVDANEPGVQITANLSKPLPYPYYVSFYKPDGPRLGYCTYGYPTPTLTNCTMGANVPVRVDDAPYEISVYLAQDSPLMGPPIKDVRASRTVSATNVGYNGSISLATDRTQVDASTASLTATLSKPVVEPYKIYIVDILSKTRLALCSQGYSAPRTTCQVTVAPTGGKTGLYVAYVAQNGPTTLPTVDVAAKSNRVAVTDVSASGPVDLTLTAPPTVVAPYVIESVVQRLAKTPLVELCDGLTGVGVNTGNTSLTDVHEGCLAAVAAGQNLRQIIKTVATIGGLAEVDAWVARTKEADPATDQDVNGPTAPTLTYPDVPIPTENDDVLQDRVERTGINASTHHKQVAIRECRKAVARAGMDGVAPQRHPPV